MSSILSSFCSIVAASSSRARVADQYLRLLLLAMETGDSWALLSPESNFHKLCEPNFFIGREVHMDLTLKVG